MRHRGAAESIVPQLQGRGSGDKRLLAPKGFAVAAAQRPMQ
jgi:hypothetical protein